MTPALGTFEGRNVILTLTPNPTIDRVVFCRDFRLGMVVRAERETVIPSGKGVDASLVIHELGGATVALGLTAGLNGRLHRELLDRWGIAHDLVPAWGETRMAVVLVDLAVDKQSTISAPTLSANAGHLARLCDTLARHADRSWGLICGGSLPPGFPGDSYARLLRFSRQRGLVTLLDASGEALCQGVLGLPHVLKVNAREVQTLDTRVFAALGTNAGALDELTALTEWLAVHLGEWASEAIVVTLGERGALAVTTAGTWVVRPPDVPVINTAGAGDALAAGIMMARSEGRDWPAALILGTAAAASVVMNKGTAICRREQVEELAPRVQVTVL
jgi:1-phosphofructokinase family hexose kinase